MKKLLILFAAIIIVFSACEKTITDPPYIPKEFEFFKNVVVGSQPSKIYYDNQTKNFHIFCLGIDANYNGQFDAGDENPSWWVINEDDIENPIMKQEFNFGYMGFPFRPCFDLNDRLLFISQNGKILSYNIDDFSLVDGNVGSYDASAISKIGDTLFLSIIPGPSERGYVILYNYKTRKEIGKINSGINTRQTIYYEINKKKMLAILSEGSGNDDVELQFLELRKDSIYPFIVFKNIGKTGNYLERYVNLLAVVMNFSNEVIIIDLSNLAVKKTINTGTSGFDGPREASFVSSSELLVTTYTGDVRFIDINSETIKKIFPVASKAEGICIKRDEYMLVSNISNPNYSANNIISIFKGK